MIWFFRIAKRNPAAAVTFHILAAFPAIAFVSLFVYLFFILPEPLSGCDSGIGNSYPFAVQGKKIYMLVQSQRGRGFAFGYYNRNNREFTSLQDYPEEGPFDPEVTSIAWDGKQMAITIDADKSFLLVTRNDSVLFNQEEQDDLFISRDAATGNFHLAIYDFPYHLVFAHYDRHFRLLGRDTFYMDDDTKTFSFNPQAIQYLGKTWYANGEDQTFRLEFSNDTGRYVPLDGGGISGYDLFGSLTASGSYRWLMTDHGIQKTGLPEKKIYVSPWQQENYYRLYPDSMSWRFLLCTRMDDNGIDNYFNEGNIRFHETASRGGHAYEYDITYPGAEPVKMKVFKRYSGLMYSNEMVFVSKDSLEVYYGNFNNYAIFNTLNGKRIDEGGQKSILHEWLHDQFMETVFWLVLAFTLFWIAGIIFCLRKKTNRFLGAPMYAFSLVFFFFAGTPYVIYLLAVLLD